jgi:MoxR-like ATPase
MTAPLPRLDQRDLAEAERVVAAVSSAFSAKVVGQDRLRESLLVTLLAGGHLLIESVPGLAKTTAARVVAESIHGVFRRIQCTPDLLPSDIIGTQIYEAATNTFATQLGPVHANIVLLDEINRSSAKTQSAMLEAMEERQTTIAGVEYPIPEPFLVIATQNPVEQAGTYKLPEAQLDRFLIKTSLGYPDREASVGLLLDAANRQRAASIKPIIKPDALLTMAGMASEVFVDPSIMEYINDIVIATRSDKDVSLGVSMRGALALARAVKTWAIASGRAYVTPDDVRDLAVPVLAHRVIVDPESEFAGVTADQIIDRVLVDIAPPAYRAA